jgi:hypothetical protein
VIYLTLAELLYVAERTLGHDYAVRDYGFYGLNGRRLTLTNDAAYDLVMAVAAGELDSVDEIAAVLRQATRPAR